MPKLLLNFLFLYSLLIAQESNPMLWEITGNNLHHPSYIFGTYHTRDPEINDLHISVLQALYSSQKLYTEIMLTPKSETAILGLMRKNNPLALKKRLDTKTIEQLAKYLKQNNMNLKLKHLNPFKTWAIALMISNESDKKLSTNTQFMDERLVQYAQKKQILQFSLETPEMQLKHFDALTEKEQELLLLDTFTLINDTRYTEALKEWYKRGESKGFALLQKQFSSPNKKQQDLDKKLLEGLLFERNVHFLHRIHTLMQEDKATTHFFAIGAGHLSDKEGLVFSLKTLGYTLKKQN